MPYGSAVPSADLGAEATGRRHRLRQLQQDRGVHQEADGAGRNRLHGLRPRLGPLQGTLPGHRDLVHALLGVPALARPGASLFRHGTHSRRIWSVK